MNVDFPTPVSPNNNTLISVTGSDDGSGGGSGGGGGGGGGGGRSTSERIGCSGGDGFMTTLVGRFDDEGDFLSFDFTGSGADFDRGPCGSGS
jgi:hypothetical protein